MIFPWAMIDHWGELSCYSYFRFPFDLQEEILPPFCLFSNYPLKPLIALSFGRVKPPWKENYGPNAFIVTFGENLSNYGSRSLFYRTRQNKREIGDKSEPRSFVNSLKFFATLNTQFFVYYWWWKNDRFIFYQLFFATRIAGCWAGIYWALKLSDQLPTEAIF